MSKAVTVDEKIRGVKEKIIETAAAMSEAAARGEVGNVLFLNGNISDLAEEGKKLEKDASASADSSKTSPQSKKPTSTK